MATVSAVPGIFSFSIPTPTVLGYIDYQGEPASFDFVATHPRVNNQDPFVFTDAVIAPEPYREETGWWFRVKSGIDFSTTLAQLYDYRECSFTRELSAPGVGSVSFALDDPALGVPLPPGITSNRTVLVDGIYQDPIDRGDQLLPFILTPPDLRVATIDVHSSTQFLRFAVSGAALYSVYCWYTDESNYLQLEINNPAAGFQRMRAWLMNNGTKTLVTETASNSNAEYCLLRTSETNINFNFGGNIFGGGFDFRIIEGSAPWIGFVPGNKLRYDFATLGGGSINPSTSVPLELNNVSPSPGSFVAYGVNKNGTSLGTFAALSKPWVIDDDGSGNRMGAVEISDNRIHAAWGAWADGGLTIPVVDVGSPDGSWQAELSNFSNSGTMGLVLRYESASHFVYVAIGGFDGVGVGTRVTSGYAPCFPTYSYWPGGHWADGDILRATLRGNLINVYRNSTLIFTGNVGGSLTETRMGLWLEGGGFGARTPKELSQLTSPTAYLITQQGFKNPTWIGVAEVTVPVTPTDVVSDENLWQIMKNNRVYSEFFAEQIDENVIDTDQSKKIVISGRGTAKVLEWGEVFPKNWPTPTQDTDRVYLNTPLMKVWRNLLAECQARDTLKFITLTFSDTQDSAGLPWIDSTDITVSPGDNLLQVLTRFCELIGVQWVMEPGLVLSAYRDGPGTHRESEVVFNPGHSLLQQNRQRLRQDLRNVVAVKGKLNHYSGAQDNDSIARWHRREMYVAADDAQGARQRELVANATLNQYKKEQRGLTVKVQPDLPLQTMFIDYDRGDWVGVQTDDNVDEGACQVVACTLSITKDKEEAEVQLISKRDRQLLRLKAMIERLSAGASANTATSSSNTGTGSTSTTQDNATKLADLGDVNVSSRESGDILSYNGTRWVPVTPPYNVASLADLIDVNIGTKVDGSLLKYNASSGKWVPGTAPSTVTGIPTGGTTGQVLKKNSNTNYDADWSTPTVGFSDPTTTTGDLIVKGPSGTTRLGVGTGTDGYALTADSAVSNGVRWKAVYSDPTTTKGDLPVRTIGGQTRFPLGTDGQALVVDSTTSTGLKWAPTADPLPVTTKGDLVVRTGTATVRLPVGSDNKVLVADSTAAEGVSWQDPSATGIALPVRQTVSYSTASLGAGATETGTINIAKGYRLLKVQFSAAARLRLYGTTAERTSDASRAWGVDPAQGMGLMLDYLTTTPGTFDLSPVVDGFSTESVPVVTIPFSITATGASVVTVTLTYLRTE